MQGVAPARSGGIQQDLIELQPGQHGQRAGHVDVPAARADAAHMRHVRGLVHHLVVHAQSAQRGMGVGDQAVAADLVARKDVLVDQQHREPGLGQLLRTGTARRAGADDDDLAGGWDGGLGHGPAIVGSGPRWTAPA
jgi:hypothetical protein